MDPLQLADLEPPRRVHRDLTHIIRPALAIVLIVLFVVSLILHFLSPSTNPIDPGKVALAIVNLLNPIPLAVNGTY